MKFYTILSYYMLNPELCFIKPLHCEHLVVHLFGKKSLPL